MNDEALKKLWQEQSLVEPALPSEQQISALKQRMKKLGRTLFWRDIRENIGAVFTAVIFSFYFCKFDAFLVRAGCVIVVASALFNILYLFLKKRVLPKLHPDESVTESLRRDLQKTNIEIGLLRSVLWWYVLPGTFGVMLFYLGLVQLLTPALGFATILVSIDLFLCWLNERAVDRRLMPLKYEIEALLDPDNHPAPPEPEKKHMTSKLLVIIATVGLCFFVAKVVKAVEPSVKLTSKAPAAIDEMLARIVAQDKIPAMSIAVVADGKIVATNAVGVRKYGGTEKVTIDDQFHLGSVTKSMTATVAAMLVEQGKISWTTTIGEIFSSFKGQINGEYHNVTLEQLLAQRGGVPGNPPNELWRKAWLATGSAAEQRLAFIKGMLAEKPEAKPGTKFIYSNQGYTIAGVMLEIASGKTWENLMQTMLFEPLGMKSAGFGAPATLGKVDQPWGHKAGLLNIEPVPPGPAADNPLAISPAGAVHCSMEDLAKYAAFHLAGERGEGKLLKPGSFKKLHQAVGDDYALGWMVLSRGWAKGNALMHNGSNTMFYVVVWIAPERNFAVVVATNTGSDKAFPACDAAASELIRQFLQ